MIPIKLTLSGFLSYRERVEIDFSSFSLACIAGPNGAGKSSLLDAITWALFGQARKRDDSLIHAQCDSTEVILVFSYEGNQYRVQRSKVREKPAMLDFQIRQNSQAPEGVEPAWKTLNERSLRDTEAAIVRTLRLDYETFVNASFFLQGKADQFTQQRPGDRKRILSSILGLEIWESYRLRAADRRKKMEAEIARLDGRLVEINAELSESEARRARLAQLEADLARVTQVRQAQETTLQNVRKYVATLEEQRKLVATLERQVSAANQRLEAQKARLGERQDESQAYASLLARASEIEAAYAAWQESRSELENWESVAARFREHEKRRQRPLDEINAERARLSEQASALQKQFAAVEAARQDLPKMDAQIETVLKSQAEAEARLAQRAELESQLGTARQRQAEARAENPRLKAEMDELKERIDQLSAAEGADCPTCGQPLSPAERESLIEDLSDRGREMGDRYRSNQSLVKESDALVKELEAGIASLSTADAGLRLHQRELDQLTARREAVALAIEEWEQGEALRLGEIQAQLEAEAFAPEARQRLAEIDAELKEIGYDAAAHDRVRQVEAGGRASGDELRQLENARAALAPLEREIAELVAQIEHDRTDLDRQIAEHARAAESLVEAEAGAPDLYAAERELFDLQEQENRLRLEMGAARQKVLVLEDLKERQDSLENTRQEQARLVGQYKMLERAFSKDGVPALLIEQALPEIESKSNEILDRLSSGNMSVRFVTQAAYKDKRRDDLKETLDILISDGAGTRDYEMFSGGEAFRVNFAIRLALSEVLAQRAGARLQTLVIDEGFGSQDSQGRQRLIEAINLVSQDFSKILVITHIDELKDAFPARIEVEKTPRGSQVSIY
jgi:DNA repair protein SbcC/Rad50